jgi:hypothetical protein
MTPLRSWALPVALLALSVAGCDKSDSDATRQPPPPPPLASAKAGACQGGGGVVADPVSKEFFARVVDGYCVDPQGEVRTYGEQGKLDMDAVCTTAFDGECAIYNQFGLKRLVSLRYVDGGAGGGTVDVYLSRFADPVGAYAMFTKRIIADSDPAEPTTPKPLAAGGAGAIGTGRAYVWKNQYLAELQYNNELETPEALAISSARVLTAIGKSIGALLPGPSGLPASVEALPKDHRITNGTQLLAKDALGITGLGPLAVGYYADGPVRYRLVALLASDDAKAKDAFKLVRSRPGALPVAGVGQEGVAITLPPPAGQTPDAKREYVFARKGALVVGAGDDEFGAATAKPGTVVRLTRAEKVARLTAWLSGGATPPKTPHI